MPYSALKPLASQKPSDLVARCSAARAGTMARLDGQTSIILSRPGLLSISISDAAGAQAVALMVVYDDATDTWGVAKANIGVNTDSSVATRLNRLMSGYAPSGLTVDAASKVPGVRKYWRTGHMAVLASRRAQSLPATYESFDRGGHLRWRIGAGSALAAPAPAPSSTVVTPSAPVAPTAPPAPTVPVSSVGKVAVSGTTLPVGHPGIFRVLPLRGGIDVWQDPMVHDKLEAAVKGFALGKRTFVVLRGPTGSGKTLTAMDLAARHGLPFWKVDVPGLRDFGDWAGYMLPVTNDAGNGTVMAYVPSQFVEAIDADGPYGGIRRMVMLDELSRVETSGALNALLPCLDGHGTLYVTDARKSIHIDPAVMFVGTANVGSAFSGTVTLDPAFVNRATTTIRIGFADATGEAKVIVQQTGIHMDAAERLVRVAAQTRVLAEQGELTVGVSTRQLVAAAHLMVDGLVPLLAAESAFADTFSDEGGSESHRAKVMQSVEGVLRGYSLPKPDPVSPKGVSPKVTTTGSATVGSL